MTNDAFGKELQVGDAILVSKLHGTSRQLFINAVVTRLTPSTVFYKGLSAPYPHYERFYDTVLERFRTRIELRSDVFESKTIPGRCVKFRELP